MAKAKAVIAPETKAAVKEQTGTFVQFYDSKNRVHVAKSYNISNEAKTACVGSVVVSRSQKKEKDAERVTYSYLRILIKRPINGEDVVVKDLSVGVAAKTGAIYVKENEIVAIADVPTEETC